MTSFKDKYEELLNKVTKFNKGKENLNDILSYQKVSYNHFGLRFLKDKHIGLGCSKNNIERTTHVYKKNNDNSFVKKNMKSKYKYIWISKNLNNMDKKTYIISYVCYDAGGEHLLYIFVITCFLQGEFL